MIKGFGQKTHFFLILGISLCLIVFLALRPKVVVSKENQTLAQKPSDEKKAEHILQIPTEVSAQVLKLRNQVVSNPKLSLENFKEIGSVYSKASIFDSSGFYFEKAANINSNEINWIKAGEAYSQAANLALSNDKIENALNKARLCYIKVLEISPKNLFAKTNMAMTFVNSDSPMKAIGMLREVLAENPKFVPAIMSLGGLSMKSGQYDKAVLRFKDVLMIDPNFIQAKIGLGYSLIELNKKEEGKKYLTEVLKYKIDVNTKDEILKTLNSIK